MEHAGSIDVAGSILGANNHHIQQQQQQPQHRQSNTAQMLRQSAQANAASTASSHQPLKPSVPHQRSNTGKPISVVKGSGSTTVNTNQPTRRRVNTENALYEGTVRGPRVTAATTSRFVGAAVQRAQERAREAMRAQKKRTRPVGVVELGDGLRQFSFADENAAPPARGGFELFLDAKSREWDPEGAKLHPKAVNMITCGMSSEYLTFLFWVGGRMIARFIYTQLFSTILHLPYTTFRSLLQPQFANSPLA